MRAGTAGIIIDNSSEGPPYQPQQGAAWHRSFSEADLPPGRFVFITQDRRFARDYNAWCDQNGIGERVAVLNYDYHLKRFFAAFEDHGAQLFAKRLAAFEQRRSVEKSFVALNNKLRPYRLALLTRLLRDGLWDDGFVSTGGMEQVRFLARPGRADPVARFLGMGLAEETKNFLPELIAKGEVLFGEPPRLKNQRFDPSFLTADRELDIYRRSWFSLVPETEMRDRPSRITEKPMKALSAFHPIIVFGNPGALELLREFGFKTFGTWIDETYDDITDPEARFRHCYAEFCRFRIEAADTISNDRELRDTLAFNAEHALIRMPELYRDGHDRRLCEQLLDVLEKSADSQTPVREDLVR